jgi:hypothetical protein
MSEQKLARAREDADKDPEPLGSVSPPRAQPRMPAVVKWSAAQFADIIAEDGNDAHKQFEFEPPTPIATLLSADIGGIESLFPAVIDTLLDELTVWYPSTALSHWTFRQQSGQSGEWAATNAFIRISTIATKNRNWGLTTICIRTLGAEMTAAGLKAWAHEQHALLAVNPHALLPSLR